MRRPPSYLGTQGMSWKGKYRDVQQVLRQCCARDFRIEVGDGTLAHFHPAKDCDFSAARLRAYEHAVQFARARSRCEHDVAEHVVTLEWEPIESGWTR